MLNLSYPRLLIVQIISDISTAFAQNLAKRLVLLKLNTKQHL